MLFNDRVTSITQEKMIPAVIDSILNSNVLVMRTMLRGAKNWSGEHIKKIIKIAKSTTGGSFEGTDTFTTTVQDTRRTLKFYPKGFYQNVTVIGMEKAVNATDAQVLSLVKTSLEEAQMDAMDSLGTIFYADGTGNSNKDFDGLGNIVDDGVLIDDFGGLSRATYATLKANIVDLTSATKKLSLSAMRTLMSACSASGSGRQTPTIGVTSETVWGLYESLLQATVSANYQSFGYPQVTAFTRPGQAVQASEALAGTAGFKAITFAGMPIVSDEKSTVDVLHFLNETYIEYYKLNGPGLENIPMGGSVVDGVYQEAKVNSPFQWTGWKVPVNQYAESGQLIALGNLVCGAPRRQGKLIEVEAV